MEAITKKCTKCGEVKSLSAFYKRKDIKSGVRAHCKACEKTKRKAYDKAYRKANADKIAEYQKAYHKANADKIRESKKAYEKAYRKANADKIAEYDKAYYKSNADKIAEYQKAYRKAYVDNLTSGYIASKIGLPISDIPPEFMELKRAQLKLHRLIKQKK